MTETAKERIYREALDEINNLAIDVAMDFEGTGIGSVDCGKIMDIANKAFFAETNQQPSTTDKLSVEKLQEQLNTAKKALTEIIFLVKVVMTLNILLLLHEKHSQRLEMKGAVMSEEIQCWRDIIQQNGKRKQPQLTIHKSIADELDKRWEAQSKYLQRKVAVPRDALYNAVNPYDNQLAATKIGKWIDDNQNICFAYLAGKALGVDLVKVGEG